MTDAITQAIEALAQATNRLAQKVEMLEPDVTMRWLTGGLFAATVVLAGVALWQASLSRKAVKHANESADAAGKSARAAEDLVRIERERQQDEKRGMIVGLMTELYMLHSHLASLNPVPIEDAQRRSYEESILWSFDKTCTVFFDTAQARLFLHGAELLHEIVGCYMLIQRALFNVSQARYWAEDAKQRPYLDDRRTALNQASPHLAKKAHDSALNDAYEAIQKIGALLPKLSAIAGIDNPLHRSSKQGQD